MTRALATLALCWIATVGASEAQFAKIKSGVECESSDTGLGKFNQVAECAEAARKKGAKFFVYGTGSKAGACYIEHTTAKDCPEGFESDKYDFYQNTDMPKPLFTKIKSGAECKSSDTGLGKFDTVEECAEAAFAKRGKFFVYGTGSKAGGCYIEKTSSKACKEGWESDKYDFYGIESADGREQSKDSAEEQSESVHAKKELAKALASGDKATVAKAEKAVAKAGDSATESEHAKEELSKALATGDQTLVAKAEKAVDEAAKADGQKQEDKSERARAAEAMAQEMSGDNSEERKYKTKEKKDTTFRKGLFRMGMRFQGLLHQLSNTDDKKIAEELKEQLAKLQQKLPKYVVKVSHQELQKVLEK